MSARVPLRFMGRTRFRRRRHLPRPGEVRVSPGDLLRPEEVVARALTSGGVRLLNVARALGVGSDQAERFLVCRPGQALVRGEVVARRRTLLGLRQRRLASPADARLLGAYGSWALLSGQPQVVEVLAGYRGSVAEVHEGWGAVLECQGVLVEAVWGCGGPGWGPLRLGSGHAEESLAPESVDDRLRGALVVAGAGAHPRALARLAEVGARGLVVGSLDARALETLPHLPYPVVLTDGFGSLAMAAPAWELLAESRDREASMVGVPGDAWEGSGPEVFVPLSGEEPLTPVPAEARLEPGRRVRLLREPHLGRTGVVESLIPWPHRLPSGALVGAAWVSLEGGGRVAVANCNLELLSAG